MSELDTAIHAPVRLRMMSLLAALEEAEFAYVRDELGVSDSVLSKHAAALEVAGYVVVRKGHVGKRPRTWLGLSAAGRRAYQAHVAALQEIVARSGLSLAPDRPGRRGPGTT
ncbi:transcriptional regulator [Sphaerisporangium rufum]|uniref:Transcriptional regulator n=1 Tax=Sphaerisporangium rufum TaxID=1381558 RepID=A0A919V3N0_9ACTN|nr:transcriptional regulator [Sphaerisporangium rufum]GII80263.1 transcriptional regulator [Sphaerisporangium rufum]